MIFQERKQPNDEYTYDLEDVFGKLHIISTTKLTADILDGMVVLLLRQNLKAEKIDGEIKHEDGIVKYQFTRASQWGGDDEIPCENTHTSTSEQVSGSPAECRWNFLKKIGNLWNWSRRYAGAFREAWKNVNKK